MPGVRNPSRAAAIWPGETCFIVAGGPSLKGFDFSRLAGRRVIAINSSVFACPAADVLFFGDARWWWWHGEEVCRLFPGQIYTASEATHARVDNLVKRRPPPHLSTDPGEVCMQHTSLTGTINLAVHFGCQRIVLLGADQQAAPDGTTHHHEPHPVPTIRGCWDLQMKELREMAKSLASHGVQIINTSLGSRIDWWPKQPIEELL